MRDPIHQKSTAVELMILGIALIIFLCWMFSKPVGLPADQALLTTSIRQSMLKRHEKAKTIKALNGLRVLLVSQVILNHFGPMPISYLKSGWFQHQPMSFFTILSGFIRTHSMREPEGYSFVMIRAYWARVFTRFGPAYWLALVWVGCVREFEKPFLAWPTQAVFLHACLPVQMDHAQYEFFPLSANWVGWFTSCIVIASCCFPFLHNALLWVGTVRIRARAFVVLTILVICRCLLTYLKCEDKNAYVRLLEFVIGMLSAQIGLLLPEQLVSTGLLLWAGWGWVFDASLVAFYLVGAFVDEWSVTCQVLCQLIWPPLIISSWASVQSSDSDGEATSGLLGKALSWKPISSLAEYSFGAYIYQVANLYTLKYFNVRNLWYWLPLFGSWGVAVASEHFFEKHIRRLVDARIWEHSQCS